MEGKILKKKFLSKHWYWLGWVGGGETIKNDFLVASTEILFLPFMENNNYDYNQFFVLTGSIPSLPIAIFLKFHPFISS